MLSKNFWSTFTIIAAISSHIILCQSQSQNISEADHNQEIKIILKQNKKEQNIDFINYKSSQINSQRLFGDIIADSMKVFVSFSSNNEKCNRDGHRFIEELINQTIWAVQMYDSSAKYPTGVLIGEVTELGRFDECMSTSSEQFEIYGAYVIADVRFRLINSPVTPQTENQGGSIVNFVETHWARSKRNMLATGPETMLWAVCVPDSCTADDVRISMEHRLRPVLLERGIAATVNVPSLLYTSASTATLENSFGGWVITCMVIFISTAFAIIGTFYGLFIGNIHSRKIGFFKMCLNSFSITNNMNNLIEDPKNEEFILFNGFKLIGLLSVIIGHRVALGLGAPTLSPEFSNHIYEDFSMGFLKTPVIVEIFFIISGFLTHIIVDGRLKKGKPLQFFYLIAFRIIRILPMYITVMLIFANVLPYIGDGPMWKLFIHPEAEFCRKNWWTNLLFINNYINTYEMCMFHSWYLACDIHFFVVGILLTYITHRWKRIGQYTFVILFLLSVYFPARYIYVNEQWGVLPYFRSNLKNHRHVGHFHSVYIKSHFRITTYLIGVAAAYIYSSLKSSKFKFSIISRVVGFIVCILMNIICVFLVTGYFYLPWVTYNPWDHVLYFTLQRIIFSMTISYFLVVGSLSNFANGSKIRIAYLLNVAI